MRSVTLSCVIRKYADQQCVVSCLRYKQCCTCTTLLHSRLRNFSESNTSLQESWQLPLCVLEKQKRNYSSYTEENNYKNSNEHQSINTDRIEASERELFSDSYTTSECNTKTQNDKFQKQQNNEIARCLQDKENTMKKEAENERDKQNISDYRGVVELNSHTLPEFLDSKVPVFLFFTVHGGNQSIDEYNERVCYQIDLANRHREFDKMNEVYQEFGVDAGLAIKLGVIDCRKEPAVLRKYSPCSETFPMIYFMIRGGLCDKLIGIVNESQVKEAIDAFIDYAKEFAQTMMSARKSSNNKSADKIQKHDCDEENAMTLLTVAAERLRKNEVSKANELYQKALDCSLKEIELINEHYGVMRKKITPELWRKLKNEGCYNSAPVALCGLAMCALATNHRDEAQSYVERVRRDFPLATSEIRDVATAVVRIELVILTEYSVEKDSYTSLLRKFRSSEQDAVAFYMHELKLCTAAFIERHYNVAIETCIKVIRIEPKILKDLKAAHVVPDDLVLGPTAVTPARQVMMKLFEGIGKNDQKVIQGRKILQQYLEKCIL